MAKKTKTRRRFVGKSTRDNRPGRAAIAGGKLLGGIDFRFLIYNGCGFSKSVRRLCLVIIRYRAEFASLSGGIGAEAIAR
jgi:hypothetical protein